MIDWRGLQLRGHGVYDLVRMAMSIRLPAAAFAAELKAHCTLLQCEQRHLRHHLMCAFAQLADNLGAWPVERFAELADLCLQHVDRAA